MKKNKKKFKQPSNSKLKRKKHIKYSEIFGVVLLFLSTLIFISLMSYNPEDPSWASVSSSELEMHNLAGKVGASLAEALLQLLGFASFILSFGLLSLGIYSFLPKEKHYFLKITEIIILTLIFSTLIFLVFQDAIWRKAEIQAGGLIGSLISSFLIRYFNHTGTYLFLIALLLLFIVFSTRLSIGKIFIFFSRIFQSAFKEIRFKIIRYEKEKHRKKMKQDVLKKYSIPKKKDIKKKEPGIVKTAEPQVREKYLFEEMQREGDYEFPPFNLLDRGAPSEKIDTDELYEKKMCIEDKLRQFKVEGEVKEYHPGPIVTTYEFFPHPGIKVSQVSNLSEDLSLALGAESVRIQRIPGKSSLGVEVPNNKREIIKIRDIIQSDKFYNSPSKLTFALGKTIHGEIYITDLSIMPHLLIAGATGTGKSVALNSLITSILYKATPDEVKLILIDPKRLEFSVFESIPHLLCPVVRDPKKAGAILIDAIKKMEDRYHKLGLIKVRNIEQYNQQVKKILKEQNVTLTEVEKEKLKPLPHIVIIIDELSELMMIGAQEVEYCIARLSQLARAVGIHLVLATQRPSIDVITGTIKNNFSSRIALRVPSKIDSRIIIDVAGAEKLLGKGDMLFMPPNYPRILRLHCSYITLPEITRLVKFVKEQRKPDYDEKIINTLRSPAHQLEEAGEKDSLFEKAVELILLTGQASASYLQRKLKLGYARASRIIDQMEEEGIVGPPEGSKPREILVDPKTYLKGMEIKE